MQRQKTATFEAIIIMAKSYKYRRSRKPISLKEAKLRMTDAIKAMEEIILSDEVNQKTVNTKIQAVHALSGIVSRYAKVIEVTDLKDELDELKQIVENRLKK